MKRVIPRRAKIHRSYTAFELGELLGVHRNTVGNWIERGLPVIDDTRPMLICGAAFQAWWASLRKAAKRPCQPGQIYCFKCREPKAPAMGMVEFVAINAATGNLRAMCETCGTMMHRRTRLGDIARQMPGFDVQHTVAPASIVERPSPSPNCDKLKGA